MQNNEHTVFQDISFLFKNLYKSIELTYQPFKNKLIHFIKEGEITESYRHKLVMPVIDISESCFQISKVPLIMGIQSIEKV